METPINPIRAGPYSLDMPTSELTNHRLTNKQQKNETKTNIHGLSTTVRTTDARHCGGLGLLVLCLRRAYAAEGTNGTLLSLIGQLGAHDVLKTAVLAAIGAVVSFLVSGVLQWWAEKRRGR